MKFSQDTNILIEKKTWKCRLKNANYFVQALICWVGKGWLGDRITKPYPGYTSSTASVIVFHCMLEMIHYTVKPVYNDHLMG